MSVQSILGYSTPDGKLELQWHFVGPCIAYSVQVGLDSECTQERADYVCPNTGKKCIVDVGSGSWYVRVGAWIGTETDGIVDWSAVYGPFTIKSNHSPQPLARFPIVLTGVKPALNSIKFHTGLNKSYYMIIHYTKANSFRSSHLKTIYIKDWGVGCVPITNLDPHCIYSFQLQMFSTNIDTLPKDMIQLLTEPYDVIERQAAKPTGSYSTNNHTLNVADKAIVNDAIGRRTMKFASHSDYIKYKAAISRTSGT